MEKQSSPLIKPFALETLIQQYYRRISWTLLVVGLTLLFVLALLPITRRTGMGFFNFIPVPGDKVAHFIAFIGVSGLIDAVKPNQPFTWKKAALAMAFGLLIELCQSLSGYRFASFWDSVANALGIFTYWLLTPVFKWIPIVRVRWMQEHQE